MNPMAAATSREICTGLVRIFFGFVWTIDAYFKWQPAFITDFSSYLTGSLSGQSIAVQHWINFWIGLVNVDPVVFAYIVVISETGLAILLILGVFSNVAYLGGSVLCLVIWSTAEGLGGPYKIGSTDIGTAIIYVFVFALLFLSRAGLALGLDRRLTPRLGRWGFLASGPLPSSRER